MWSKISSALKPREGHDSDLDHSDALSNTGQPPPDPFCANATTYYTQQTPPTPPPGVHSRTASREEDIIWSLRTQLALQQEMCAQFEIDLGARDELVEALTLRLDASEKENDKRRNVVRSWKKKAADLEKMCRHLEEEVDNSRRESMGRSIMDEASGEALRQLHRRISQLERERNDTEAERNSLAQTVENMEAEITRLRGKSGTTQEASGDAVRQLHHQISELERERNDLEVKRNSLVRTVEDMEAESTRFREKSGIAEEASGEAVRQLHRQISQLERERNNLEVERNSLAQTVENMEAEITRLKEKFSVAEEASGEAVRQLHHQISQLERKRNDLETERNTLAREKGDVGTEQDNLSSEISRLRVHIQQLQKDSAVMEVTIVQLNKQLDQDKEDINGLNIALESKQQELELVKRKHGARGTVGPTVGRTGAAPSTAGKPAVSAGPPSKTSRTSTVVARTSSPVPLRVPSTLGRTANTKPPITSALRRASISGVEFKTKLPNRRVSITSIPSEVDEKENASIPVPLKNPRRTMVPA